MLVTCQDYIPITEYVKRHFFLSAGAGATVVRIGRNLTRIGVPDAASLLRSPRAGINLSGSSPFIR